MMKANADCPLQKQIEFIKASELDDFWKLSNDRAGIIKRAKESEFATAKCQWKRSESQIKKLQSSMKAVKFGQEFICFSLLLLITRPLPRDEGMAEHHGAPEAGQLPRVWTRGRKETKSRQKVSGAKSP